MTAAGDSNTKPRYWLLTLSGIRRILSKKVIIAGLPIALVAAPGIALAVGGHNDSNGSSPETQPSAAQSATDLPGQPDAHQSQQEASVSVEHSSPTPNTSSNSSTNVTINGETVPVPENGQVRKKVPAAGNNETSIDIDISNGTSGSSRTYTDINVYSHSYSNSDPRSEDGRSVPRR